MAKALSGELVSIPDNPNLLSERQLAMCLGLSHATIRRWRGLGGENIPTFIKLKSKIFYETAAVRRWLESRRANLPEATDVRS